MSVWPNFAPLSASLLGSEGELVSVSISVEPRLLEDLLEALAHVPFPINPQIYHQAATVRIYPDGRREMVPSTVVEFPAYAGRLREARAVLQKFGFDAAALHVRSMIEDLCADAVEEPAPAGAPYRTVLRYKQAGPIC
jgi:hypothetical protein